VFEDRVLRGIFRPERDEGTGEWKQLSLDDQIKENGIGGARSTHKTQRERNILRYCETQPYIEG
jgi:hypothetical protein